MTGVDLGIWTHGPEGGAVSHCAENPDPRLTLAVKANIAVRGWVRSAASPFFEGDPCRADAPVIAALRARGATVVGMTNMHELALGITSENAHTGAVRLPSHPDRSAGGSSGGSAAAVAAGLVPIAIGTDTGGSVSIPASHCGVVGFRPSTGRWSTAGTIGLSWTRDTLGVFSTTVAEAAQVDSWVTGSLPGEVDRIRLGISRRFTAELAPEVDAQFAAVRARLDEFAEVVEVDDSEAVRLAHRAEAPIVGWELRAQLAAAAAQQLGVDPVTGFARLVAATASDDVRSVLQLPAVTEDEYAAGQRDAEQARVAAAVSYRNHGIDALIFPTTPAPAPRVGAGEWAQHRGEQVSSFALYTRHTGPGTILGVPMLTLPTARAGALPLGITVQGRRGDDARLLAIGQRLQAHLSRD